MKEKKKSTLIDNSAGVHKDKYSSHESFFTLYVLPVIRVLNIALLIIFVLALGSTSFLSDKVTFNAEGYIYIIVFTVAPLLSMGIRHLILSRHEFSEWDKIERYKKKEFSNSVTFVVFFFTYLTVFNLAFLYTDIKSIEINELNGPEKFDFLVRTLFGILFMLNSIFTVPLHYKIYSASLVVNYRLVSKKPENWDSEARIKDEFELFE